MLKKNSQNYLCVFFSIIIKSEITTVRIHLLLALVSCNLLLTCAGGARRSVQHFRVMHNFRDTITQQLHWRREWSGRLAFFPPYINAIARLSCPLCLPNTRKEKVFSGTASAHVSPCTAGAPGGQSGDE